MSYESGQDPIAYVISQTRTIPLSATHYHGYRYATVDDVYSAVRYAMAEAGIHLWCSEVFTAENEVGMTRFEFCLILDGQPLCERESLHMPADFSTPQKMQAARSMAIKYYLRSKFLIPTGEVDEAHFQAPEIASTSPPSDPFDAS